MDYIPISRHNARSWELESMDTDVKLKCPDQNGVLTVCDYSRVAKRLASVGIDCSESGMVMYRNDNVPIQAQYVRPTKTYDPFGRNVFLHPVDHVSVMKDAETGLWYVDRPKEDVTDIEGLFVLVWAMSTYGLKKKKQLAELSEVSTDSPQAPVRHQ